MSLNYVKICIVDDEEAYFNKDMLSIASNAGFKNIERFYKIDAKLFENLQTKPRDIVILDIKNITSKDVAKDGLGVASALKRTTNSYIAITSAHQLHLSRKMIDVDYIIEDRLLTAVDFIDILIEITENYLEKKMAFYKKVIFKLGFKIVKQNAV
jgi:hypothetical protein